MSSVGVYLDSIYSFLTYSKALGIMTGYLKQTTQTPVIIHTMPLSQARKAYNYKASKGYKPQTPDSASCKHTLASATRLIYL